MDGDIVDMAAIVIGIIAPPPTAWKTLADIINQYAWSVEGGNKVTKYGLIATNTEPTPKINKEII